MTSKYHVHHEHERTIVTLTIISVGFGLLLIALGASEIPMTRGFVESAFGCLLLPLSYGLWRAREWGRIGVGHDDVWHFLWRGGPPLAQGVFLLLPRTKRAFSEARAAIEREREAGTHRRGSRMAPRKPHGGEHA